MTSLPVAMFKWIYLVGCAAAYVIRVPHVRRAGKRRIMDDRVTGLEGLLAVLSFLGMTVIPAWYAFTRRLAFADYGLPAWAGWLGATVFAFALWLLWRAHSDLGRNWSATVRLREGQALVTGGVYRCVRHPIYAAHWLWGVAQALLVQNWIAGLAGLALYLPILAYRIPREERMMLAHFGREYRSYMERTGRLVPRLRRQVRPLLPGGGGEGAGRRRCGAGSDFWPGP